MNISMPGPVPGIEPRIPRVCGCAADEQMSIVAHRLREASGEWVFDPCVAAAWAGPRPSAPIQRQAAARARPVARRGWRGRWYIEVWQENPRRGREYRRGLSDSV